MLPKAAKIIFSRLPFRHVGTFFMQSLEPFFMVLLHLPIRASKMWLVHLTGNWWKALIWQKNPPAQTEIYGVPVHMGYFHVESTVASWDYHQKNRYLIILFFFQGSRYKLGGTWWQVSSSCCSNSRQPSCYSVTTWLWSKCQSQR